MVSNSTVAPVSGMLRLFIFSGSSIVLVSVTNSFSDTPTQFYCNNMKMEHIQNFMR